MSQTKTRCPWVNLDNPLYIDYHDKEWGKPVHDDHKWFEMLILEGAQAGLSWETILKKREGYRKAFADFDPQKVALFTAAKQAKLLEAEIVRNRRKIASAVENAKAFLQVQAEFGSFDKYIWGFVGKQPIQNNFKTLKDYPAQTELSQVISKDLKKRGFSFVGPTIIYAFMQATGLVNDHTLDCYKRKPWFVYLIECKDKSLYTGITTDVKSRFAAHNGSPQAAKYLKGKGPLSLVFHQKVGSKSQASKMEAAIKKLSKAEKIKIIQSGTLPKI